MSAEFYNMSEITEKDVLDAEMKLLRLHRQVLFMKKKYLFDLPHKEVSSNENLINGLLKSIHTFAYSLNGHLSG